MPEPQPTDARSAPLLDPENAVRCDTEGEAASGPSPQASEAPPPATKGSGSAALVFVLWNTMMGSTLLVMPSCFRESGWLLGLVLAVLCAGVSTLLWKNSRHQACPQARQRLHRRSSELPPRSLAEALPLASSQCFMGPLLPPP